jgi:stage V sporulation protein G
MLEFPSAFHNLAMLGSPNHPITKSPNYSISVSLNHQSSITNQKSHSPMSFTIQNFRLSQSQSNLKAFFDVQLDNGIVMKGFKIAQGPTGLFVGVPSEKDQNGKWWDRVIIPKELKEELNRLALAEYSKQGGSGGSSPRQDPPETDLPF